MRNKVIQEILDNKIIAIIRGVSEKDVLSVAHALFDGGIHLMEVTFNQKDPDSHYKTCEAIRAIKNEMGEKILVGAGTVTTPELVETASEAGALFIVSPDTDPAVIRRTVELGMVSLPGAYTASEAKQAHMAGADFVKLFPCVEGAPAYLKALCAPLSHIRFVAVGGVNADNIKEFFKAGAVGAGLGSCLVNRKWVEEGRYDLITEEAKKIVSIISAI